MNAVCKIRTVLSGMQESGGIRFSDVRLSRLVYFMAYTLELVIYQIRGASYFNCGIGLFGLDFRTTTYVAHMAMSLVVMLLWSDKFKPLIWVSVAVMILGFIPWIFLPSGYPRLFFAIIGMAGLGGVVTCARCGYAFATNNAEKLLGVTLTVSGAAVVRIFKKYSVFSLVLEKILPVLLLAGLALCLLKFKSTDFEVKKDYTKSDAKGLYWALALFILYFAIDGHASNLLNEHGDGVHIAYIAGCILPCLLFPLLIAVLKLKTRHMWSIFFIVSLAMGACAVLAPQYVSYSPEILFCGLSRIGWPLAIYTLGCAQRRFASYKLLKISTLVFVAFSPLTTLSSKLIYAAFPDSLSICSFVYVLVLVVSFLILSPLSDKHLFGSEWISDIYKGDMKLISDKIEEVDRFKGYELTPRQKEVAVLLLTGKTRRQVSGELGLSESTVKMHTAELYRRLDINSRNELFRIFGVTEAGETQKKE